MPAALYLVPELLRLVAKKPLKVKLIIENVDIAFPVPACLAMLSVIKTSAFQSLLPLEAAVSM